MMSKIAVLCAAFAVASADVSLARTVTSIVSGGSGTVTLEGSACTSKDAYGSNDCTFDWGTNYTAAVVANLPEEVGEGATLNVDVKIDGLLPLKFSCAVCGAVCEFTIPLIGQKVSLPLPACPLVAAGPVDTSLTLPMPEKSPFAIALSLKGDVTIKNKAGAVLLALDVTAKMSP